MIASLLALTPLGWELPLPVVVLGTIVGLTYGLLGVGLVLIYRTNRVINFAHGEIGLFVAAVFGLAVQQWHVPYYVAFPLALVLGAGVAAAAEAVVVRRLRNAPRVMSIVATLGVGQFLLAFGFALNSRAAAAADFPIPPFLPTAEIGALTITRPYMAMLLLGPGVVLGLSWFLRATRVGLAMRTSAANPEAARMAGVFAGRMSSLAWALAGALSAFTAILVLPSSSFSSSGEGFGPSLLLRALAAAVVGRMTSLPRALAGGIVLGVVEQLLLWNRPESGFASLMLFVVIVAALALQRRDQGREEQKGSWTAVLAWRPVPEIYRQVWAVRNLGTLSAVLGLSGAVLLAGVVSNATATTLVQIVGFSIIGISITILTGLGGELTLGQYGIAAVGAVTSVHVASATGNFVLAFAYAAAAGGLAALLIGLPAIRTGGLMLAVSTLAFALVAQSWGLQQPWALGAGLAPGRPELFGRTLVTGRGYFAFTVVMLAAVLWFARNIRRSGIGRMLVAVRDNAANAAAFSVRTRRVRMLGFALAGAIAGVGGAVIAHSLSFISGGTFTIDASVDIVAMTVLGGISLLAGPVLGALYIIGVPQFVELDAAGLAATQAGWLILILYLPGGMAQALLPLRDRLVRLLARGAELDATAAAPSDGNAGRVAAMRAIGADRDTSFGRVHEGHAVLEVRDLRKAFGGVIAVNGVSFDVRSGQTVGLIGPNGAGKTTLFEVLGGFTTPDAGQVAFAGRDVTRLRPESRAALGMIRSFQDAALFPTMTVLDAVMLAFERTQPTSIGSALAGMQRADRHKAARALELVDLMGLAGYRSAAIQELSTGTRRITEITCLLALQPTLLLLDEPASGVAQRETEALGELLVQMRRELDLSMIVIEHDIPMIMAISDRIVVLDRGRIISEGSPGHVRNDPLVVEAYLGRSAAAIERSGPVPATASR